MPYDMQEVWEGDGMIISEKQIMQLMKLIQQALRQDFHMSWRMDAHELIDTIMMQQSEELKVIE